MVVVDTHLARDASNGVSPSTTRVALTVAPTGPRALSRRSDAEQAPLSHLVQQLKANRWVPIGHVDATARGPARSGACHGSLLGRRRRPVARRDANERRETDNAVRRELRRYQTDDVTPPSSGKLLAGAKTVDVRPFVLRRYDKS